MVAFVWLGVFALCLTRVLEPIRAYMRERSLTGMEPLSMSSLGLAVGLAFFVLGHVVPLLIRSRRMVPRFALELGAARHYRALAEQRRVLLNAETIARAIEERRALGCAVAIASALGIACIGFFILRRTFHGPHQDPMEFLAYFYLALFALVTHLPRVIATTRFSAGRRIKPAR